MKKLLLAITAVALMAMPAFASVQNIKVSGSIDNTFLHRDNFDLGSAITPLGSSRRTQDVFFTQTIVGIAADLSDNVSANVALINERAWNDPSTTVSDDSDIKIFNAYVTLRQMLYSPLTVVVGRQSFHYGNSFIVDSARQNNDIPGDSGLSTIVGGDITKQTALDAARAILDYNPLTLEFLFAKVDANTVAASVTTEVNEDDVNLFGVNATWEVGDAMKTQVEGYFFAKIDESTKSASLTNVTHKHDTVYVPGLRASTNPIEGLNVQVEVALQRGTKVPSVSGTEDYRADDVQRREAYGAEFIANYQIPVFKEYKPVVQYVYSLTSGDHSPPFANGQSNTQASSERWTAWDPMFENQAGGTIYNSLYDLSGAHIHTVSLQANPMEDVTVKGTWTGLWTDRDTQCGGNSLGCAGVVGTIFVPGGGTRALNVEDNRNQVGNELDFETVYNYTEDVQIGANFGWFIPGDIYHRTNDNIATQAIVHANVNF